MDKLELTQDEIYRLKQLVCDHEPDDSMASSKCICCDQIHTANCKICGLNYDVSDNCHDPEDEQYPYCSVCS